MRHLILKPGKSFFAAMSIAALASLLGACAQTTTAAEADAATPRVTEGVSAGASEANQVFELRTYITHPGKLNDLHSRFSNHTMRLFEKHGIRNIAYWTPTDTPNTLVYIVAHKSQADAKRTWKAFVEDPEWRKAYAESHANGPLVANIESTFLKPTNYSPRINSIAEF